MIDSELVAYALECPKARADLWTAAISRAAVKYHINTPLRTAHFLAQIGHESGRLLFVHELASGRAYNGRIDLGNMKPEALSVAKAHGSTPGQWWRGHGLIQITGYYNHKICGEALGLDLVNQPTLLEHPDNAALSAGWFWHTLRNLNPLADADDLVRITKRVNGGRNGIDDRRRILERAKIHLGVA